MAVFNLDNYLAKDGFGMSLNIRRGNPNPLDNSSVWGSLAEAQNYAKTDPVAYVGQILTVVTDVVVKEMVDGAEVEKTIKTSTAYIIDNEAGDLKEVGSTYDDATLVGRIDDVEDSIDTVIASIGTVAEGKTLAEMIADATYDDTTLAGRVKAIEDDYLKSDDKTELTEAISAAEESAVDRILGYLAEEVVNEKYDTLKEVAAWIESDTTASAQLITRISDIEKDYLKGADKTELEGAIGTLSDYVGDLPEGTTSDNVIAYIQEVVATKADKGTTLAEYGITDVYTKTETETRLQEVLDGLSDTSETAASVAQALETYKTSNDQRVGTVEAKLETIVEGAQVNVLEAIKINGVAQTITDKAVDIPIATDTLLGVVMGSAAENKIAIAEDGTMEVNSLNVNKLTQDEGTTLILNGGSASA
jgi:hypothetical protein